MQQLAVRAGVDWASDKHDVVLVDEHGERVIELTVAHDRRGLDRLVALLDRYRVTRVTIERPDEILVERVLDANIPVISMHPNQVAAARPRLRAAGGTSDRFDAWMLAELTRTDHHRFGELTPDSDDTRAMRALTRGRDDLVHTRVALANQLRAERFWPGAARIFADIDSPIALAFLERHPAPDDARGLNEKRLAAFPARHSYCGRRPASELLERRRDAPAGRAGNAERDARRHLGLALVAALKPIPERISQLTSETAHAIHTHPNGAIFLSFFRDPQSVICAATLLPETGDARDRYPTPDAVAADNATRPVAIQSGKPKHAAFRRACDHRRRAATSTRADATRHWHPRAGDIHSRARSRGHDHPHAIRTLGRARTRVLWRCRQTHQPYDPTRHQALTRMHG